MQVELKRDKKGRVKVKDHIFTYMLIETLLDRWWFLLGCSLLCGIVVLVYTTFFVSPIYEAQASLLALKSDVDINKVKNNLDISNKLLEDYVILAKSDMTLQYAIDSLELPEEYTVEKIRSQTAVARKSSSNIIVIKARDASPENAANIVNGLTGGLQNTINTVLIDKNTDFAQFSSIFEKAVVSTKQVYPNVLLSVISALIIGFILAMILLCIIVASNLNVVSPGQARLITNLEILGQVAVFEEQ